MPHSPKQCQDICVHAETTCAYAQELVVLAKQVCQEANATCVQVETARHRRSDRLRRDHSPPDERSTASQRGLR